MLVEQVRYHRLRGHLLYVWRNTTAVHRRPSNDAVRCSGCSGSDDAIHGGDAHHPRSFTVRAWLIGLLAPSVHSCIGAGTCVIVMSRCRASFLSCKVLLNVELCIAATSGGVLALVIRWQQTVQTLSGRCTSRLWLAGSAAAPPWYVFAG